MESWYASLVLGGAEVRERVERAAADRAVRLSRRWLRRVSPKLVRDGLVLERGEVVSLPSRRFQVAPISGRIWLTLPGVPGDHILEPGDALDTAGSGRVVIQALTASVVRLGPAPLGEVARATRRPARRAA